MTSYDHCSEVIVVSTSSINATIKMFDLISIVSLIRVQHWVDDMSIYIVELSNPLLIDFIIGLDVTYARCRACFV